MAIQKLSLGSKILPFVRHIKLFQQPQEMLHMLQDIERKNILSDSHRFTSLLDMYDIQSYKFYADEYTANQLSDSYIRKPLNFHAFNKKPLFENLNGVLGKAGFTVFVEPNLGRVWISPKQLPSDPYNIEHIFEQSRASGLKPQNVDAKVTSLARLLQILRNPVYTINDLQVNLNISEIFSLNESTSAKQAAEAIQAFWNEIETISKKYVGLFKDELSSDEKTGVKDWIQQSIKMLKSSSNNIIDEDRAPDKDSPVLITLQNLKNILSSGSLSSAPAEDIFFKMNIPTVISVCKTIMKLDVNDELLKKAGISMSEFEEIKRSLPAKMKKHLTL